MDGSEPIWPPDEVIGEAGPPAAPEHVETVATGDLPGDRKIRVGGGQWSSHPPGFEVRPIESDDSAPAPESLDEGPARQRVPNNRSPWAHPPRRPAPAPSGESGLPAFAAAPARVATPSDTTTPTQAAPTTHVAPGVVRIEAPRPTHVAVLGGTERAGRLAAKQLATALDHDHRLGTTVSDAGAVVGAPAWTSAVDAADRLILAVDAVGTGPVEAAGLLDRISPELARDAVTVVLLPPPRRGLSRGHEDIGAIRAHFQRRTHTVLFVPNDPTPTPASLAAWARVVDALA